MTFLRKQLAAMGLVLMSATSTAIGMAPPRQPVPPVEPPPPPAPTRWTLIGDSHFVIGCMGGRLQDTLLSSTNMDGIGIVPSLTGSCGTSANAWTDPGNGRRISTTCGFTACQPGGRCPQPVRSGATPYLTELMFRDSSEVFVISLGSNMLRNSRAVLVGQVDRLVAQARSYNPDAKCVWLGPPQPGASYMSATAFAEVVRNIRETVEARGCRFIDSTPLTDGRQTTDGIHYTCRGYNDWSDRTYQVLQSEFGLRQPGRAPAGGH